MNKIKGCSDAIKIKHLVIIFVVSLLVALPTRTYQLLALVNTENGFFENGDFTVPLLYGCVGACTLLFLVFSFLCKGIPAPKFNTGKNPFLAIASLLMAGGFVWDIISIERKIVPQLSGYVSSDVFKNLFTVYLEENGGTFLVLEFVFAILGVFWSLIFAASYFEGKAYHKKFPLLALSPLCWCISVLVSKLMEPISFITVSELLFEIFMLVFAMLFFITFARICTGVFTENSMWGIFAYGFAAALFAGMVTIPRLIIYFSGLDHVAGYEFSLTHLSIFVFVIVAVLSARGIGFKHGLKNIQSVSELDLPDDEDVVVKESNKTLVTEIADDEISYMEDALSDQNISATDSEMDIALDEYMKEMEEKTSEISKEEPVAEVIEEATEEPAVEVIEEATEEPVIEAIEEVTEEPVIEAIEEATEEPVIEVIEEVTEEPVIEVIEEATEELAVEVIEEATEEPVIEAIEEATEEPVIEAIEEVTEEPVIEAIAEVTEENVVEAIEEATEETEETFGNISEMLIDDSEDIDKIVDDLKKDKKYPKKTYPLKTISKKEKKDSSEKPKKEKVKKSKKKSTEDSNDEPIKIMSLADLKKEKDSE